MYEMEIVGAGEAAAALRAAGALASEGQYALAQESGTRGVATVRGRAVGRPGPRRITGHYLTTIDYRVELGTGGYTAIIYSDAPQARRLELGFYGTDSLGRYYQQPAYEHFRPARDELYPWYLRVQGALAARVVVVGNSGGAGTGRRGGRIGRAVGRVFRR
jgi:hypothetical protein